MSDRTWPMLEQLFVNALNSQMAQGRAGTRLPAAVETSDGFVRVTRGPGGDDGITDQPLLDLEAFHPMQKTAWDIAEDARQIVLALPGARAGGHIIDSVETSVAPNRVEYGPHIERYVASYRAEYRR